jgi:predicted NUDIX family phosphoesterase
LDRLVLCQTDKRLLSHRINPNGFEFISQNEADWVKEVNAGIWHLRYDCDEPPHGDELALQVIPYTLLLGRDRTIFCYTRSEDIKTYGEVQLFRKLSVGLGGHIVGPDAPDYLGKCVVREMTEEVDIAGRYYEPTLVGTIFVIDEDVDRRHFGMVYSVHTDGDVKLKETSIESGSMRNIAEIVREYSPDQNWETWSRVLIPYLGSIYDLTVR